MTAKWQSVLLVFRSANLLAKRLIRFDVTLRDGDEFAVFRQSMHSYERVTRIPCQLRLQVPELDFGDYERYPTNLRCQVRLLTDGMRHFPASIELVTIRVRSHNVKVETGDEEAIAEYTTKFNFFLEEFDTYRCQKDVTVTFSLKLLKQFLSAWDKKAHDIDSFFKEQSGIVFVVRATGFTTQFMVACVAKDHAPNSPVASGDETMQSTNVTYLCVILPSAADMLSVCCHG